MAKTQRSVIVPIELPDGWWTLLDDTAERLGVGRIAGSALASAVASQSRAYTTEREQGLPRTPERADLAARLRFFLTRDLAKVGGVLHQLQRLGRVPGGRSLRVLDLGAGLGGTALGASRWFAQHGDADRLQVVSVEQHSSLSRGAQLLADGASSLSGEFCPVDFHALPRDILDGAIAEHGPFDLIVAGFVLNELFPGLAAEEREQQLAGLLQRWAGWLRDDGVLVVLEPALKQVSRSLSAVRDRVQEEGAASVLAPCARSGPCPMLEGSRDWCHADLPLGLPEPLVPIAREAGLRWERLTYSYLVLGRSALPEVTLDASTQRVRMVSQPLPSKGKLEWHGCGPDGLLRFTRLNRDKSKENKLFGTAVRGDLLLLRDIEVRGERIVVRANSKLEQV